MSLRNYHQYIKADQNQGLKSCPLKGSSALEEVCRLLLYFIYGRKFYFKGEIKGTNKNDLTQFY